MVRRQPDLLLHRIGKKVIVGVLEDQSHYAGQVGDAGLTRGQSIDGDISPGRFQQAVQMLQQGTFPGGIPSHNGRKLAGPEAEILIVRSTLETIKGREKIDRALQKGKGIVLLTAHFGNWELISVCLILCGYKGNIIAKRLYFDKYNEYPSPGDYGEAVIYNWDYSYEDTDGDGIYFMDILQDEEDQNLFHLDL